MAIQQSIDSVLERHVGPHGASENALSAAFERAEAALAETNLGELLTNFMLETIIAAHLLGVDPFDQLEVEEGKVLTKKYVTGG